MIKVINEVEAANNVNYVATHSGVFHADDVMAASILSLVGFKFIVRTRNQQMIENAVLLFDVGGKYDGEKFFDHHQNGFKETHPSGEKYSSAGLLWKKFGQEIIKNLADRPLTNEWVDKIHNLISDEIMKPIDTLDNGEAEPSGLSFSALISSYNCNWTEGFELTDSRFEEAIDIAYSFLVRRIESFLSLEKAETIVRSSEITEGGKVLILDKFCPWQRIVFEQNMINLLFGIYQTPEGEWMLQCIPPEPGSFDKRLALPEKWAGLRDREFQEATTVDDGIFCHPGRFICGSKSKAGALKLASLALKS